MTISRPSSANGGRSKKGQEVIEVILFDNGNAVKRQNAAWPEDAVFMAHQLWDEARSGLSGQKLSVGFYIRGKLIRLIYSRSALLRAYTELEGAEWR